MAYSHECALCGSHSSPVHYSTYKGHPIEGHENWITKTRHYHSNNWAADTLAAMKRKISDYEG
jgi:recombinational DNA repair protein (RecF pathway)